jgi:hypothetical protein
LRWRVRRSLEFGDSKIADRNPDLEMVMWGVSFEKACEMADDLNADPKLQHVKD